jgi:sensor histidine kinase YesM
MNHWFDKFYRHRYFLFFILVFAYVESIYLRTTNWQEINAYTFTPDAAIGSFFQSTVLFSILFFTLQKWQKSTIFETIEVLKIFGVSLVLYLLIVKMNGFMIALIFDNVERNFNSRTFFYAMFTDFLNGFIYGSFFLTYYYFNKYKAQEKQITNYQNALSETKINQLKTQLNPHFLFNNLNILDQLIDEDKQKASDFLNEFAEIYRYVLQAMDKSTVPALEELDFVVQYFKMYQYKYGNAYQLRLEGSFHGKLVPLTLQLLIENAIQHNLGSMANPVVITINSNDDTIKVSNNYNPKKNSKTTAGRALQNINEQYMLLSERPIKITKLDHEFSVIIPII